MQSLRLRRQSRILVAVWGVMLAGLAVTGRAQPPEQSGKKPAAKAEAAAEDKLIPLNKQETVLLDKVGKRLLLKSKVVLRQGALELLCCLKQTKEHEAILAVDTKAYVVHAGLLALGMEQGRPVAFEPEYRPPTGQKIDIYVQWTDEQGKLQRVPARDWIRYSIHRYYVAKLKQLPPEVTLTRESDLRWDPKEKELLWYGPMTEAQRDEHLKLSKDPEFRKAIEQFFKESRSRPMEADWVFAGSGFYVDPQSGEKYYRAEDGDLICVANFASATIDIAAKSTSGNEELLFEAWTERIPPMGTEVTIELIPAAKKPQ